MVRRVSRVQVVETTLGLREDALFAVVLVDTELVAVGTVSTVLSNMVLSDHVD
jgi:hypothetical protein